MTVKHCNTFRALNVIHVGSTVNSETQAKSSLYFQLSLWCSYYDKFDTSVQLPLNTVVFCNMEVRVML